MKTLLFVLASAVIAASVSAQEARGIGYPTVAAALKALQARSDVSISLQGGWTIVDDRAANAIWSFTPPGHPAHPAAIKRAFVSRDGELLVDMTALCQADEASCDKLMAEFKELNDRMIQAMRGRAQGTSSAPASEIEVQRLGDGSFRLVLKSFRSRTIDAGQEELYPKAREVCGGRDVGYGKYEFESIEALNAAVAEKNSLVLKQEISCGAAAGARPPTVSVANKDPQWRPTSAQVQLVERQTYAYFSAKDGRRYQEAYAMFSAGQKQTVGVERWNASAEEFNAKAGEVLGRSIRRITWYKDPPRTGPGVYAAVDFSSRFANTELHCGFVAWHEQADGSFLLVREEQNFVDKSSAQKMKPGELEKLRAQFGC